jgi:hypothetical protein
VALPAVAEILDPEHELRRGPNYKVYFEGETTNQEQRQACIALSIQSGNFMIHPCVRQDNITVFHY